MWVICTIRFWTLRLSVGAAWVGTANSPRRHLDLAWRKRIGKIDPGIAKSDVPTGGWRVHDGG
jgi:hypothetical protein